ncbi:putative sucrose utilization protein SUC1 [Penicillium rolfsii]|nr:putative sucrose utilization protein SUC1 [Penicillium rolfsii]
MGGFEALGIINHYRTSASMMASPCDGCFVRRVKCDRQRPCQTCLMRQQTCTYFRVRKKPGPKGPRSDTTLKIEEIQRRAMSDVEMATPAAESAVLRAANSHIPISSYYAVLDVFQARLHDVWPIADIEQLKCHFNSSGNDPLLHALAAALCAATLAQLRLGGSPTPCLAELSATAEDFAKECLRIRLENHYNQKPSLEALTTSIFLHMYYANRDQVTPATISLREAITYADIMHLGHTPPSNSVQSKQWQLELRCFWILFVTERTFCIQHDLPITLQRIPNLPEIEFDTSQGNLYAGFCALVQLFLHVQRLLVLPQTTSKAIEAGDIYSKDSISEIQQQIQVKVPRIQVTSEIQHVDILTTSAWVRSLLWQYSASRFMLSSSTSIEPLSFEYPLSIAKDYLECLSHVSIDSLRSHGYGMVSHSSSRPFNDENTCPDLFLFVQEIKLLQVANSLLDFMLCMPKLLEHQTCRVGPFDAVLAIEQILSQVGGSNSERLSLLHQRLSQIPSSITLPLTLDSPEEEEVLEFTLQQEF